MMIEDEGPGLPEGKEDEIFSRFFTDRPEDQGFGNHSGLGLAICKQIIEAHRGSIIAETMRDPQGHALGARFTIVLPPFRAWVKNERRDGHTEMKSPDEVELEEE